MCDWAKNLSGRFVVFDGPDGSGKSTQFARFAAWCREREIEVREVREPGGSSIGEQIRRVLLDPDNAEMSVRCEMLLYMASRAQLVDEVIRPALERSELVLADRFISSTLAYQGSGGGVPREAIIDVGGFAVEGCWPDLVVVFDIDPASAAQRLTGGARRRKNDDDGPTLFHDRLERRDEAFRARVRAGYLEEAERDPARWTVIDGAGSEDAVFERLLGALESKLTEPARR